MPEKTDFELKKVTLIGFIREFLEYASNSAGVESFPLPSDIRWHIFLWELKAEFARKFPDCKLIGNFDWDGPYPKSRKFNDSAFALGYFFRMDLLDQRMYLKGIIMLSYPIRANCPMLLETAYDVACGLPGFFER